MVKNLRTYRLPRIKSNQKAYPLILADYKAKLKEKVKALAYPYQVDDVELFAIKARCLLGEHAWLGETETKLETLQAVIQLIEETE